jgi:hypothetical protein
MEQKEQVARMKIKVAKPRFAPTALSMTIGSAEWSSVEEKQGDRGGKELQ